MVSGQWSGKAVVVCLILCIGFAGCSKKPDLWRGRIEVVNGVRVMTSEAPSFHRPDSLVQITLTKDLVIEGSVSDSTRSFPNAYGVTTDRQGNIYIADAENFRILKFDARGNFQRSLGSKGVGPFQFLEPVDMAVDRVGNLYVVDSQLNRVTIFTPQFKLLDLFDTQVIRPRRLRVDAQGNILVFAITQHDLVYKFSPKGEVLKSFYDPQESWRLTGTLDQLIAYSDASMEVTPDGYVYLSSRHPYRIVKFDRVAGLALQFSRMVPFDMGALDTWKGNVVPPPLGTSGALGVLPDGRMLNLLQYQEFTRLAQAGPGASEFKTTTVKRWFDVFTPDGKWQMTSRIDVTGFPVHVDREGRVYFVELDPSRVVRYTIGFPKGAE